MRLSKIIHFRGLQPQTKEQITPGRVAQSFPGVLAAIGTPADMPKPRGKSPGWKKGKQRKKKTRYPVVKKTVTRQKKEKKADERGLCERKCWGFPSLFHSRGGGFPHERLVQEEAA